MASIQDVLATLAEKEAELQHQVLAIRAAIVALGGTTTNTAAAVAKPVAAVASTPRPSAYVPTGAKRGRKPKGYVAPEAAQEAVAAKPAKAPKAEKEATGKGGRKPKEVRQVGEYAEAKSWNEKVVWALSKSEKLTAEQITESLHKFEGGEFNALKTMISSTASTLAKKGGIDAVRVGRGFEYSLKA